MKNNNPKYKDQIAMCAEFFMAFLITVGLFGCGAANYTMTDINNFEQLSKFARQKEFEIENRWANPLRANTISFISNPNFNTGNINLIGNPNYIKFKEDSIDVFLPFFGVRQMGGGYNDRGAIKFKGIPEELNFTENKDKDYVRYEFSVNDDSENYQFFITLYSNGNASTSVTSSQRDNISYTGKFEPLQEEDQ